MRNRFLIIIALLASAGAGGYAAYTGSRLIPNALHVGQSDTYTLLFQTCAWFLPLAGLMGLSLRTWLIITPKSIPGKILRHDDHMFLFHWCNALSILILYVSGFDLGPLDAARQVHTAQAAGFALNMHFIGVAMFLFGVFYVTGDLFIKKSLGQHMPTVKDIGGSFTYYRAKLTGAQLPGQEKFLSSEKLAFPFWFVFLGVILVTGGIKTCAMVMDLPGRLLETATFWHDMFALGLLPLIFLHVFMGAVVPWSWPLLRSMVSGYMDEDYVRRYHSYWYAELKNPDLHNH